MKLFYIFGFILLIIAVFFTVVIFRNWHDMPTFVLVEGCVITACCFALSIGFLWNGKFK